MKNAPEIDELTPEYVMQVGQEWIDALLKATPTDALLKTMSIEDVIKHYTPAEMLARLSPKERDALLKTMSIEDVMKYHTPAEMLARLSPKERLAGLSSKERLAGLSSKEREELQHYLEQLEKDKSK